MMKQIQPVCAEKKIDLALAMQQLLQLFKLQTYGLVDIPARKVDVRKPRVSE